MRQPPPVGFSIGLFVKENSPPPPYEEISDEQPVDQENLQTVDLLASCKITEAGRGGSDGDPAVNETMGLMHSTPWGGRHRSKVSLTWVLREQSDAKSRPQGKRPFYEDFRVKSCRSATEDYSTGQWNRDAVTRSRIPRDDTQVTDSGIGDREYNTNRSRQWRSDAVSHYGLRRNESEVSSRTVQGGDYDKISRQWNRSECGIARKESQLTSSRGGCGDDRARSARIVGRNEFYNGSVVREVGRAVVTSSEGTSGEGSASERGRRRHRRRRRRDGFGYEINNIDGFLAEASIERPGNIPVVLARASTLHETRAGARRETPLPLGSVVNAVFRKSAWLYVQTPHAHEGYVPYAACLPLGILPADSSESPRQRRKTPCWESSTDVYPRPCGNMTDAEKARRGARGGRARSECGRPRRADAKSPGGEEAFDRLYLRAASLGGLYGDVGQLSTSSSENDVPASRRTLGKDFPIPSARITPEMCVWRGGRADAAREQAPTSRQMDKFSDFLEDALYTQS